MTLPSSLPRTLLVPLIALLVGWFPMQGAQAAVVCTATMTALNFGTVDLIDGTPTEASATLDYVCTNDATTQTFARVCFNIGDGAQSLGSFNPRNMEDSGGNDLKFQIYQSATATIWGSNGNTQVPNPYAVNLTIPRRTTLGVNGRVTGTATLRGVLGSNQSTVPPGAYQDNFAGVHTSISQTISTTGMPTSCDTLNTDKFEFIASATVSKSCVVAATPLNFGPVDGLPGSVNIDGLSTVSVTCSRPTPYTVALTPQNGNTAGSGVMRAVTGGNTDTVPYRLYSNVGRTVPWGSSGNLVAGTGNGLAQPLTVYGRVPTANVTPDDYLDIVTVNVVY